MIKIISFLSFSFLFSFSIVSQKTGVVRYTERIDFTAVTENADKRMDSLKEANPENMGRYSRMQGMMKDLFTDLENIETELWFDTTQTLYTNKEKDLTADQVNGEQNWMKAWMPEPDKLYTNLNEKRTTLRRDFMKKIFIIQDELEDSKWKLTGKQKVLAGLPCMQATKSDTSTVVEVWFTPQIPVSSGPRGLHGLPGLILEAKLTPVKEFNPREYEGMKGMKMFSAKDSPIEIIIQLDGIEFIDASKKLEEPSKGQKVDGMEKYQKLVNEKVAEMQKMHGGKRRGGGRKHH